MRFLQWLGTQWFIFKHQRSPFKQLGPGDIAIDCGANVGDVTAKMAASGATVYAFEPHPVVFHKLQERFRNNPNVHCLPTGVWDKNSTINFYSHKNAGQDPVKWSVAFSMLSYKGNVDSEHPIQVPVIDLVQFIIDLKQPVAVLKIDVEGVEFEILEKLMTSGVSQKIKTILVEAHDKRIPELKPAAERVRALIQAQNIKNIDLEWN